MIPVEYRVLAYVPGKNVNKILYKKFSKDLGHQLL